MEPSLSNRLTGTNKLDGFETQHWVKKVFLDGRLESELLIPLLGVDFLLR